jgi:hypothetical protein
MRLVPRKEVAVMTTDLTSRVPQMEREAAEHEKKARALRQIIAGIRALNGQAEGISEPRFVEQNGVVFVAQALARNGPRGRDAVLRVMSERPGHTWKVIELKRDILGRGWSPSPKAVEANLKRMRKTGEVVCPRYGYYQLASPPFVSATTAEATDLPGKHSEELTTARSRSRVDAESGRKGLDHHDP